MVKVRRATQDDREWIINVAAKNMLEQEVGRPELYNITNVTGLVDQGLATGVVLVTEQDGVLTGCLGGMYLPNIFNHEVINLVEVFWYVLPEYRGGRSGLLLLNEFCNTGKETANDIYISLMATSDVNFRILEKRGFSLKEFAFSMKGK